MHVLPGPPASEAWQFTVLIAGTEIVGATQSSPDQETGQADSQAPLEELLVVLATGLNSTVVVCMLGSAMMSNPWIL